MGVYLSRSYSIPCNHATRKCSLDLSLGNLSVLCGVNIVLYALCKFALIPLGASNTSLMHYLVKLAGIFGLNSIVKNNLNYS